MENKNKEISQNNTALYLAQKFHRYYEELASKYKYETRKDTKKFDKESKNGRLMIAVCERIISDLVIE